MDAGFLSHGSQQVVVDGEKSAPAPVTYGVPRGTVLRPLLFLVYINDLPSTVNAIACLFADDYRVIESTEDQQILQQDFDHLQHWKEIWQMNFNPEKCEVISITNKRKIIEGSYSIHGHTLQFTDTTKYLGVTIDTNLSWGHHRNIMTKKANNTTAFLRGNHSSCPRKLRATC